MPSTSISTFFRGALRNFLRMSFLLIHRPPLIIRFQVRILAAIEENEISSTANRFDEDDATGIGGIFFAGGEIGFRYSYFRTYDLHSILATNVTITGGNFHHIAGDYYELPPEVKRSVKSWRLVLEFANFLVDIFWPSRVSVFALLEHKIYLPTFEINVVTLLINKVNCNSRTTISLS
jgi:hypothetical protein